MNRTPCVVITGASSGIGAEMANLISRRTKHLVLVARRIDKLQSMAQDLRPYCKVTVLGADLSVPEQVEGLINKLEELRLKPTVFINNAGFGLHGDFSTTDINLEQQMLQVNIHAVTVLTKWAVQNLRKNNLTGTVLNVASIGAFSPGPNMAVYFATKAYVLSLSEALNQEMEKYGINVLALCPGYVKSDFHYIAGTSRAGIMNILSKKSPHDIARVAWAQIQKSQAVLVPGFLNNVVVFFIRILPRSQVRKISARFL